MCAKVVNIKWLDVDALLTRLFAPVYKAATCICHLAALWLALPHARTALQARTQTSAAQSRAQLAPLATGQPPKQQLVKSARLARNR